MHEIRGHKEVNDNSKELLSHEYIIPLMKQEVLESEVFPAKFKEKGI